MNVAWMRWASGLAVLALGLAACGMPLDADENGATPTPASPVESPTGEQPTPTTDETPSDGEAPSNQDDEGTSGPPIYWDDSSSPPPATLSIGGMTQTAGLGTYCWDRMCLDAVGIPTPQEPLVTDSPVSAAFDVPQEPTDISLSVMPVSSHDEMDVDAGGLRWWQPSSPTIREDIPPSEPQSLELDPGLYVVSLFVRWEDQGGDATYGFLLRVE